MKKSVKVSIIAAVVVAILAITAAIIALIINNAYNSPDNDIVSFRYHYGSYFGGEYNYGITEEDGTYVFEAHGYNGVELDEKKEISKEKVKELNGIIRETGIYRWNGFDEYNKDILDGYSFGLELKYRDGENIKASGYEQYPDNYNKAHSTLVDFLKSL